MSLLEFFVCFHLISLNCLVHLLHFISSLQCSVVCSGLDDFSLLDEADRVSKTLSATSPARSRISLFETSDETARRKLESALNAAAAEESAHAAASRADSKNASKSKSSEYGSGSSSSGFARRMTNAYAYIAWDQAGAGAPDDHKAFLTAECRRFGVAFADFALFVNSNAPEVKKRTLFPPKISCFSRALFVVVGNQQVATRAASGW